VRNTSAMVKSWITYPCIRRWPCRWLFFESSRRTCSRREPSCRNCRRRTASSSSLPASMGASSDREQRGHRIWYHGTGAYCVKCGKQTARLEHLNTRILQQPCLYPDLPPSSWVQLPGKMNATARLDAVEHKLNSAYNRKLQHTLVWNRKLGKDPNSLEKFGRLWCSKCGRTFAWRFRSQNLPRTKCAACATPPSPPEWVCEIQKVLGSPTTPTPTAAKHVPFRPALLLIWPSLGFSHSILGFPWSFGDGIIYITLLQKSMGYIHDTHDTILYKAQHYITS